jgi:hypothetical protein
MKPKLSQSDWHLKLRREQMQRWRLKLPPKKPQLMQQPELQQLKQLLMQQQQEQQPTQQQPLVHQPALSLLPQGSNTLANPLGQSTIPGPPGDPDYNGMFEPVAANMGGVSFF